MRQRQRALLAFTRTPKKRARFGRIATSAYSPPRNNLAKNACSSGCAASRVASRFGASKRSLTNSSISWPLKPQLAFQRGLRFEALAGGERGARGLLQAILIGAIERRFAVVANAEAVIGVVHAVVAVKADQDDAGPVGNVLVIGDVEQQLVEDFISNPAVKNGNQRLEIDFRRILRRRVSRLRAGDSFERRSFGSGRRPAAPSLL